MSKHIYSYPTRTCIQCQSKYWPSYKPQKFCSLSCSNKHRWSNKKPKSLIQRNCKNCNKKFHVKVPSDNKKFCSHSCSAKFNNLKRIKSGWRRSKKSCQKTTISLKKYYEQKYPYYNENKLKKLSKDVINKRVNKNIIGLYSIVYCQNCAHCNKLFYHRKKVKYCNIHRKLYNNYMLDLYKFRFNPFHYPDLFDLNELKEKGFFSSGKGIKGNKNKNLSGLSRDHKISVNESIRNNYDPYYITHPLNCNLISMKENIKKGIKSSISYDQLISLINEYDLKMGSTVEFESTST